MPKKLSQANTRLVDAATGQVLIENLQVADSIWSRFCGWMFRKNLPPSSALLLRPCGSIHTMWMRIKIDVAFLCDENKVIGTHRALGPWRIALAPKGTTGVLETPAGQTGFVIGTGLQIEAVKPSSKWHS
ncbi:MAG: DUF192 domain-containing protein [Planctomycetota bacterium]